MTALLDDESENKLPKLKVFVEMINLSNGNLFFQRKGFLNGLTSDFVVRSSEILQSHRLQEQNGLGLNEKEKQTVIDHFDVFKSPSEMLRSMSIKSSFFC